MNKDQFLEALKELNIEPTETQLLQLKKYYELLIEWNERINLTAITEKSQVYLKHFYDSLTVSKIINLDNEKSLCDIGTGAGFPGIILKIFYPKLNVTLVDSLNKRIIFLNEVIEKLELKGIETIHARAEEFAKKNREKYDIAIARAVAPINILLEYCIPLIKENKYFISMKGDISREINVLNNSINKISAKLIKTEEFLLPFEDSKRTLILISKDKKTSQKYPRKNAEIKKNPL